MTTKTKRNAITRAYYKRKCEADPNYKRGLNLRQNYGITLEDFDQMLAAQNGRCAICQTTTPGGRGAFNVDHCHDTGKVRDLLCMDCNTGLGKLKHNPALLRQAADYIERHT